MYAAGQEIQVRATWSRPPWCRDDWVLAVPVAAGRAHYCQIDKIELIDGNQCWIWAVVSWDTEGRHGVTVRFRDYNGEASVDTVYSKHIRPAPPGGE